MIDKINGNHVMIVILMLVASMLAHSFGWINISPYLAEIAAASITGMVVYYFIVDLKLFKQGLTADTDEEKSIVFDECTKVERTYSTTDGSAFRYIVNLSWLGLLVVCVMWDFYLTAVNMTILLYALKTYENTANKIITELQQEMIAMLIGKQLDTYFEKIKQQEMENDNTATE